MFCILSDGSYGVECRRVGSPTPVPIPRAKRSGGTADSSTIDLFAAANGIGKFYNKVRMLCERSEKPLPLAPACGSQAEKENK